ncbi:MAG: hypothetical protein BAA02_03080 [Paenibacillaceae bacterium ZCTH02-B3]|nr:MAG: hypothetical protein BAA02_03080 [Paenibacillaceae bacterium ZCTH02-B3]
MVSRVSRLPFLFFLTGLASFAVFQAWSLADVSAWLAAFSEEPRYPSGWSRAHLFVLGWATMIAMGAVYQLVPVVLQNRQLFSRKLGYAQYAVFATGFAGLVAGFRAADVKTVGLFASVVFAGILLFAFNIGATLIAANAWNSVTAGCAAAVFHLVMAGAAGMLMGLNFAFEWWGAFHDRLLGAHLWFGAAGWFGFLITSFSYKLLPMFHLSHGHPETLQRFVAGFLLTGVWTGALSFLLNAPAWCHWIALSCTAAAFVLYAVHLAQIHRFRHKPMPGAGIRWSRHLAIGIATVTALLVPLSAAFPDAVLGTRMAVIIGWLYLWGWVGGTILAYLSKIIPFLWWTHKYGSRAGREKVPTMAEMIDDRKVNALLSAIVASLFVLVAGFGWNSPLLQTLGGTLLAAGSLFYAGLLAAVFAK